MSLTSVEFYIFFMLTIVVYYILPMKIRWMGMLFFSTAFFLLSNNPVLIGYMLWQIVMTHLAVVMIDRSTAAENKNKAKGFMIMGIIANLAVLFLLKYSSFIIDNINVIKGLAGNGTPVEHLGLLVPMGLSFYSLQLIGYILDVYWGVTAADKNIAHTALFASFFPQTVSGPISRYAQLSGELFSEHLFSYKHFTFGLQRMLWGIFKKLVIASRAGIIVDTIYAGEYSGLYVWIAAGLYVLQLYADFSGCMDIVIGGCECYGITLEENFKTPLFAVTVQEYWQRWHITLGTWLKDYILYPVLRTESFRKINKYFKAKGQKKLGGKLTSYLGMLVVWLLVGFWHGGGWKFILGQGMWFYACIVLEQITEPFFIRVCEKIHFDRECFSFHLMRSVKVFILSAIGNMFFRLDSFRMVFGKIKMGLKVFNPWIFFDDSLYKLGVDEKDFHIMIYALLVFLLVSALQEKYGSVRECIAKQNIVFRYMLWILLIVATLLFGYYGSAYDATSFIYQGF